MVGVNRRWLLCESISTSNYFVNAKELTKKKSEYVRTPQKSVANTEKETT